MPDEPPAPTSEDFREFVRAEIVISNLDVSGEQALRSALLGMAGVESVSLAHGKAAICYDPLQVTQKELSAAVARQGYAVSNVESERASLLAELDAAEDPERVHQAPEVDGENRAPAVEG